jgi:Cu/Ag efflux protein CusF
MVIIQSRRFAMKRVWVVAIVLPVLVALAPPIFAAEKMEENRPSHATIKATSITATVEKIDYKTRTVVLKGPQGDLEELHVGEEARNFNQVKKGDLVTIETSESVALEVQKAQGEPIATESTSITRAKPGEKPAGTMKTTGVMTVRVEDINYKTREATLKMADGTLMNIAVGPQVKRLKEIHKGDEVVVRYTSTVSISVKKP